MTDNTLRRQRAGYPAGDKPVADLGPVPAALQSPLRPPAPLDPAPPFQPVIDGGDWFGDYQQGEGDAFGLHKVIREVVEARRRAVDRVLQTALADGRYGVTVDDDGVRIDTEVPAGTIHYAPPGRKALTGEWRADATIPPKTVHRTAPIAWDDVQVGDRLTLERSVPVMTSLMLPEFVGDTRHSMTSWVWECEGVLTFDAYTLDYLRSEGWRIVELVGER